MAKADRVHSTPPENTSPLSPDNPPSTAARSGLDGLYVPTDVAPEVLFQAIGRLRKEAQDEIERLLSFLDATDDPDLEDDEVEDDPDQDPSLGAQEPGTYNVDQSRWEKSPRDDLEDEHDGREPSLCGIAVHGVDDLEFDVADLEPSLGSIDASDNQRGWAQCDRTDGEESPGDDEPSLGWTSDGAIGMLLLHPDQVDIEDEHDGTEPDVCGEPHLGSFDRMLDQEKSWQQRPAWVQEGEVDVLDAGFADGPSQATEGLADA
jgi:hypothetical protein